MTIAWWDCAAGASGDMMLGALVDIGVPLSTLQSAVDALGAPVTLSAAAAERHGIGATQVSVLSTGDEGDRTWADIRSLLEEAALEDAVREVALATFARLAAAEAAVHRTTPDAVHFHEVGGLDAIADVVGVAAGLAALGLTAVSASTQGSSRSSCSIDARSSSSTCTRVSETPIDRASSRTSVR